MDEVRRPARRQVLAGFAAGLAALPAGVGQASRQSEEVTLTLDNESSQAWVLQSAPAAVGPTGVSNPELTLSVGTRYRVENLGWSVHPLAFRDEAGDPLLTQDGEGAFEDDAGVDWADEGDELAFTLTEGLAAELDSYICTVHSSMVGSVQTDAADEDDPAFFSVGDLTPSVATVEQGEVVTIEATVENLGDEEGTQSVTVSVGQLAESLTVTLAGGEATTVAFSFDTAELEPGEYAHTAASEDDEATGALMFQAPPEPGAFEILTVSPLEATVTQGGEVVFDVTVQNVGETETTEEVVLGIPGLEVAASKSRALAAGEATSVSFAVPTDEAPAGTYAHTVTTADDAVEGVLTVETPPEPAAFEIVDSGPSEVTVTQGERVSVDATVQNPGEVGTAQVVTLELSGVGEVDSNVVSLAGGESGSVALALDTTDLDPGEYTYTVVSEASETTGSLTVDAPPTLEILELDPAVETITEGENLVVNATVQNVGDSEGSLAVFLALSTLGRAASEALTLESGESATVTLSAASDLFQPGELSYTVESFADELSANLTVEPAETDNGEGGDNGTTDNQTADDTGGDGSGPGFGFAGGVAAVGGLAAYAYRKLGVEDGADR